MIYLESFAVPDEGAEDSFFLNLKETCYDVCYPFGIFRYRQPPEFTFAPVTILCGGNGSGKSTLLNVMADKLGVRRGAAYNRSNFFERYTAMCRYELNPRAGSIPEGSRIITSDDVFDFLLNLRSLNEGVDLAREEMFRTYRRQRDRQDFRLRSMADYEELREIVDARRMTKSKFVRSRLEENVRERSNGESALMFFTDAVRENALYLLDEPENSLSPKLQLELRQYLTDAARFYGCQLVIATHSPFLLSMPQARIYDLDQTPPRPARWTELDNVRTYRDFFREHDGEF
ncbi:MAG: AAA family ATPase [Clostridia bacterium]|nr:AAA family ATPase [Clostridia bacterium]